MKKHFDQNVTPPYSNPFKKILQQNFYKYIISINFYKYIMVQSTRFESLIKVIL